MFGPEVKVDLRTLADLIGKRSDKLYAWLRWLVLLAAGFFSLMAGQLTGKAFGSLPFLLLKMALSLNAAGILFGAVALFGEVTAIRRAAIAYKEQIERRIRETESELPVSIGGRPSWLSRIAEWLCYASLSLSLATWCVFLFAL